MERKKIPAIKYNKDNAPFGKKVSSGKDIYEYVDANGEQRSINMKEKIQSYKNQVDYKAMIEKGYDIAEGGQMYEGVRDYTGIQGDTTDILELIDTIRSLPQNAITEVLQATTQTTNETRETKEVVQEIDSEIKKEKTT